VSTDRDFGGISPAQAAREVVRIDQCRESLISFSKHIEIPNTPLSPSDDSLFLPVETGVAEHHLMLMEALQTCMTTDYGRLMVFMPPGAAKSTYTTVVGPTWYMGNHPGSEIILASHNITLAKKHGGRGRMIVQQPVYQMAFETTISKGSTAKEEWALMNGSEYKSFGMISGATGNRADGLIIDDPVRGRADAESKTMQQKIWDAYNDDLKTRLKPRAWIILVQTRWDYSDLAGMLLPEDWDGESGEIMCRDGMMWNVICLRAKIENEQQAAVDPLKRQVGEYIWPEWFDPQHWIQYEPRPGDPNSPSEKSWASLFQQQPRPDSGNQFEYEWVNWYEKGKHPGHLMLFYASDFALVDEETEGGNPNFTEHGIGGLDEDGNLWIIDWWYGRNSPDITIEALLTLCIRHGVRNGFNEEGQIRRAIEPAMRMAMRRRKHILHTKYLPTIGNKVARFQNFRAIAANGQLYLPKTPWADRLVKHLCDFPSNRTPDDGPDVCGLFGRGLEGMVWSRERVTRPRKRGIVFGSVEWLEYNGGGERNPFQV